MSGETNRLIGLAKDITRAPDPPGNGRAAVTGEQVTIALLSIALDRAAVRAAPIPVVRSASSPTTLTPRRALWISMTDMRAGSRCREGGRGRGLPGCGRRWQYHDAGARRFRYHGCGVAAALKADECLIYTDVDGVYTTDPRVEPELAG